MTTGMEMTVARLNMVRGTEKSSDTLSLIHIYYKQLDLYYQFSHRMQKEIDEEWLAAEREKTEMQIMNYLAKGKQNYIARCRYCGKLLPLGSPFQVCDRCYGRK